jgi:hypothetical protein
VNHHDDVLHVRVIQFQNTEIEECIYEMDGSEVNSISL